MATSDGRDYFQRTRLFWMVTLSVALIYFACTVFAPDVVPFELLGPFGTFSKNLAYNHPDLLYKGWWLTCAIHLSEALVALKLCRFSVIQVIVVKGVCKEKRLDFFELLEDVFTSHESNKGIKDMSTQCLWFIQTFLFGFASLRLLIKYDPERSKQD